MMKKIGFTEFWTTWSIHTHTHFAHIQQVNHWFLIHGAQKEKKVTSEWCYHKNEKSACCLSARLSFIHLEKHTWCHKKNKSLNLSADSFILLRKPQWVSEWGRKNKYFIAHFACSFPFTLIIQVSVWRFFFRSSYVWEMVQCH